MREHTFVDKSEWGDGPWQTEPDKVEWYDEETGMACMLHRGPMGHWCGYVGVEQSHPLYGVPFHGPECDEYPFSSIAVYDGISFSERCDEDRIEGVCHTPDPGRTDDVWWLGFAAGLGITDIAPRHEADMRRVEQLIKERGQSWPEMPESIRIRRFYKDRQWMEREVHQLAVQLAELQ